MALVDAHVHAWPRGALADDAVLAPAGTTEALRATFDRADVVRAVVVQPAVCGADHSYLLNALRDAGGGLAGVVVVEPGDAASLDALPGLLRAPGVRGVRMPMIRATDGWLATVGERLWTCAAEARAAVCPLLRPEQLRELEPWLERFPEVTVTIDHVARIDLAGAGRAAALDELCALAVHPAVHVKLSALAVLSAEPPPHRDLAPEAAALITAFGGSRVMWGSDHPMNLMHGSYDEAVSAARALLEPLGADTSRAVLSQTATRVFWPAG